MQFPEKLASQPNWVCWRLDTHPNETAVSSGTPRPRKDGQMGKVPYNPKTGKKAMSNNPATWADLKTALAAHEQFLYGGVGFVFTMAAGLVGVDIDHCIENGQLNDTAKAILEKVPATYVEISPSGSGLHIFLRGAAERRMCE